MKKLNQNPRKTRNQIKYKNIFKMFKKEVENLKVKKIKNMVNN